MKRLLIGIFLLTSTSAYASGGGIFGSNHAFSSASAHALGVGVGTGYGGGGGYGGGAFINTPRIASMAYAPPAYPTATCLKAYSGGGSAAGWGFSGGVTVVDTECRKFEGGRAIINAKNNGFLSKVVNGESVADRMYMDVMCSAETTATTRDCKIHNANREDNVNTASAPANDPHAGPERTFNLFGLLD